MISENNLLPLNDTEHFLKNFLKKFPVYQTKIINPLANEQDYIYLLHLLEAEWHKQLSDQTFFLTGSSGHLSEDFFIPENQNVCILKNLRYMPLLMHSHQFIEINYVLKSNHSLLIDAHRRRRYASVANGSVPSGRQNTPSSDSSFSGNTSSPVCSIR